MVRKVGRVLAAVALVMSAAACDDNPLAEDREEAAYFRLNPSNVAVEAGGVPVSVDAVVVNKYGAATNAPVTATPCDNRISAVADTGRTAFEFPERFMITGMTLGHSCLIVRGGGITDTIEVRVIPRSFKAAVDTVGSGESKRISVVFRDAAGNPVQGLSLSDLKFQSLTSTVAVVDSAGNVTGRAPGTARILVSLKDAWGATRVDTVSFTVRAGTFTGAVSPSTAATAGIPITFTAGANPFDDDTGVTFDNIPAYVVSRSPTTLQVILPGGVKTPTSNFAVTNIGPNQVASVGTLSVTSSGNDRYEPNNTLATATAIPSTNGTYYFVLDDAEDDIFRLDLAAPRQVRFTFDWNEPATLVTMYGYNSAGAATYNQCFAAAKPSTCTISLPAGTTYLDIWQYGAAGSFTGVTQYPRVTGFMKVEFLN